MQNYDIEMWKYARELKQLSLNPNLGHEHKPFSEATLQSVKFRINSMGMRGEEAPVKLFGVKRILFLGSSITLGWGVEEKDIVSEKLRQKILNTGQPVQVLNAGIGNYNAVRYIELFLTKLKTLEPTDIVIHGFVRDAEPIETKSGSFLLKHSQLAVTLWNAYQRFVQKQGEDALVEHYRKCYDPKSESFQAMRLKYQKLAAYAKEHKINVTFVMTPDIHNLKDYKLGFVHDAMKQIAKENNFKYLDLLPVFSGLEAKQIWAMPGDPHPNAYGHQLMAEAIYKALDI